MPLLVLYSAVSVSGSPLHVNAEDDNINDMVNHMTTRQKSNKCFPSHGDTASDSHPSLPRVN